MTMLYLYINQRIILSSRLYQVENFTKMKTVVLAVALVIAVIMLAAEGQDTPSCASELIPCGDYLNATTKPPAKCCDPLKKAVNEQLVCLCNLYNSPDLLKSLKINVTQALRLPTLCGVADNLCQGAFLYIISLFHFVSSLEQLMFD